MTHMSRSGIFLSLLFSSVAFTSPDSPAYAQQVDMVRVDLPAGNMASALNRLASQSGLQMIFDASVASGLKNRPVAGKMSPRNALDRLLSGTGIQYHFIGETTVKLQIPGTVTSAADSDATNLQTITVMNNAPFTNPGLNTAELDAKAIERAQSSSVRDLLSKIPGVSGTGGVRLEGQTVAMRGFTRQSDVRILLDGAPKNFERYDQGTVFIDPELLKRVEVQKGATSVRYGNGGFGGTVSTESKTAKDMLHQGESWGFWGKTGYETANKQFVETGTLYGMSDFGGPITYDGLVSATWRKSDNMRVGGGEVYDASNDELATFTANAGAEYDGHELRGSVVYGTSANWGPPAAIRGQLSLSDYSIKTYGYEQARLRLLSWRELEDFTSTLKYSYAGDSDLVNFKSMVSYSSTSQHGTRPAILGFNPSGSLGGNENDTQYTDIKFEAENTSNFELGGLSHMANYGIQYNHHDRDVWMFEKGRATDPSYNYGYYAPWILPEGTQKTISAFFRDEIKITETFKLTPGLRYDHVRSEGVPNLAPRYNNPAAGHDYSAISHDGFTPALSMEWDVTPETKLYANWAYAMRTPNIDEIYSTQSVDTKASKTSRDLDVERNNNVNIGINQMFDDLLSDGDNLTVGLEGYYNRVSNPVNRRTGTKNLAGLAYASVPFYWNTPAFKIWGVEASAHYENDILFADLGVSWMNGRRNGSLSDVNGSDTYAKDLFPLTADAQFGFKLVDYDLSFGWNGKFVDNQNHTSAKIEPLYARPESAGYAVHGLFLDWSPKEGLMKGGEVHVALDNIFDKRYEPYLSDGITAMPGRNFKISISRKF
jgi:hemoglobin/transferrin/lactoferrin receptor protein